MPRIPPDRTVKRGWHVDYYWPGLVQSVWKWRRITLQREREYMRPDHQGLRQVTWQLQFSEPPSPWRFGIRLELDK